MQIPASCWSVQGVIEGVSGLFRFPFCLTSLPLSVAKPEVSKCGLRGRLREGVYLLPLGSLKIFQLTDVCR
jgi:hypothetical protein